ncbi:prepilin-type N-terminal cleavage/methylation domain-containing protein [bacterium]|nr:MAG: prepilin-type N-terminal cleavage/methylation domain-containing protein [bacterium]
MKLRRRAFTLIEVIVVIALLAALAAMLFPVFARAKLPANGTVCATNLHSIGIAVDLYSSDADGHYPLALDPEDRFGRAPFPGRTGTLLSDAVPAYTKNREIWRCPLDSGVPDLPAADRLETVEMSLPGTTPSIFARYGMSYGYNAHLADWNLAQPVTLWDPDARVERGPSEIPISQDLYHVPHGSVERRRANVVYADGHLKTTPWPNTQWPGAWVPLDQRSNERETLPLSQG